MLKALCIVWQVLARLFVQFVRWIGSWVAVPCLRSQRRSRELSADWLVLLMNVCDFSCSFEHCQKILAALCYLYFWSESVLLVGGRRRHNPGSVCHSLFNGFIANLGPGQGGALDSIELDDRGAHGDGFARNVVLGFKLLQKRIIVRDLLVSNKLMELFERDQEVLGGEVM